MQSVITIIFVILLMHQCVSFSFSSLLPPPPLPYYLFYYGYRFNPPPKSFQSRSSSSSSVSVISSSSPSAEIAPRRSLLQVTTDSVSFYIVVTANETKSTQAAVTLANATVEGFTSSVTPVFVPASCPANSISPEGSISVTQCYCQPGYEGNASNGSSCVPCPIDTFCASGKLGLCSANAHAPALSDSILDCSCYPGFYGNGSVSCTRCPVNSFCTGGGFARQVCTPNAISPSQSTGNTSCYCDRGFYGVENKPCTLCEPGSWCWTGIKNPCPYNSSSPYGSSKTSSCKCLDGFEDTPVMDNDNQSTSVCTLCHENVFCKVLSCPIPVYNTRLHFLLYARYYFQLTVAFFAFIAISTAPPPLSYHHVSPNHYYYHCMSRRPDLARWLNLHTVSL